MIERYRKKRMDGNIREGGRRRERDCGRSEKQRMAGGEREQSGQRVSTAPNHRSR